MKILMKYTVCLILLLFSLLPGNAYPIKVSSTERPLVFKMFQTGTTIPATGLSPTVVISKNGAAFAAPAGAVSEVGNGWYQVAANATDTSTVGVLILYATATGADQCDTLFDIIAYDPQNANNLGLSTLPTVAAGAAGGLPTATNGSGQVALQTGQVVTVSPTDANVAAAVWNALSASYTTVGTFGLALGNAGSINLTSGLVNLNFAQTLPTGVLPLTTSSINNLGNALWCAITVGAGKQTISGTGFVSYDLTGALTIKNFTLSPAAGTSSSRQ